MLPHSYKNLIFILAKNLFLALVLRDLRATIYKKGAVPKMNILNTIFFPTFFFFLFKAQLK